MPEKLFAVETLVAEFDRKNTHLVGATEAILAGFVADSSLHARFMNTLAMLEHMGSQKIMATQAGPDIDLPTLKHLAEETRHAFFFKRHANREAGRGCCQSNGNLSLFWRSEGRGSCLRR